MTRRLAAITCVALTAGALTPAPLATAAERQFLVILANSPKQYGLELPDGGLPSVEEIRKYYTDRTDDSIGSFAEYWEEISYGDVTVSAEVTDWIKLPWSIQGSSITGHGTGDAHQWFDANSNNVYDYGAGEPLLDPDGAGPLKTDAGHLTDKGYPVWKPGERFVDMNDNGMWDGVDEAQNGMDTDDDSIVDLPGPWVDLNQDGEPSPGFGSGCTFLGDKDNDGNPNCCPDGPGAAHADSCGRFNIEVTLAQYDANPALVCPPLTWNGPNDIEVFDCNGNMIPDCCDIARSGDNAGAAAKCAALGWTGPWPQTPSHDRSPVDATTGVASPNDIPDECEFVAGAGSTQDCQEGDEANRPCERLAGNYVRETNTRCEYYEGTGDGHLSLTEPWENFMRRWDPCIVDPDASPQQLWDRESQRAHWIKVYDPESDSVGVCDDPPRTVVYSDPSYIRDNYPAAEEFVEELIFEAGGKPIFGSHDPLQIITPASSCRCSDGCECGSLGVPCMVDLYHLPTDYAFPDETELPRFCVVATAATYDPPDGWLNIVPANGPDGDAYTTKLRQAPRSFGTGDFVQDLSTPEPPWYEQAWGDRYREENPDFDPGQDESPANPRTIPREAPPWPVANANHGNIPAIEPFVDSDPREYRARVNRRYFKANKGGLNGDGTGWIGCDDARDPIVAFETTDPESPEGNPGVISWSFERLCDHRIMMDEQGGGASTAGQYYDGWVEHDDLPSSKYHRAGDQRFGEVTSPYNESIYGQDRGPHTLQEIAIPDNKIAAAGPYATNIDGNYGFDAGNLMNMEWLTWRTEPPFNDGAAWEQGTSFDPTEVPLRFHPFAGPERGVNKGFRDYNLDGLIDQGEVRYAGSENYLVDPNTHTNARTEGTQSAYPFNRRRLLEDCIEALDPVLDFDNWVDDAALEAAGTPTTEIPVTAEGRGGPQVISPKGLNSGIVLLPPGAHAQDDFLLAPGFYAIHTEDGLDPETSFPADAVADGGETINWNLFFHDLVISVADTRSAARDWQTGYASHEYLHAWEHFPDLYDYDVYDTVPSVINTPVARWDIMAGQRPVPCAQVHSVPVLKNAADWIKPIDLTAVVTPGTPATITLPAYERDRDNAAYFVENPSRAGERFYFYSVGEGFDEPGFPGGPGSTTRVSAGYPATGMLVLHSDTGASPDAESLPSLYTGTRAAYEIIQADGLEQLQDGTSIGDGGDVWPGTTGATRFNFSTTPAAVWHQTRAWAGIDVQDVVPDGHGAVQLKIVWVPTTIPSLQFVNPPGGTSVNGHYTINFDATDVYGGTTIELYHTLDPTDISISPANKVGTVIKNRPATRRLSYNWNVDPIPDGRYYLFAKLTPGAGEDGSLERDHTVPRAGRNNEGTGVLTVDTVNIAGNKARSETWTLRLDEVKPDGTQDWVVNSSLSQPEPAEDATNQDPYPHLLLKPSVSRVATYTAPGGQVVFKLRQCFCDGTDPNDSGCPLPSDDACSAAPMAKVGDIWSFTTTGITALSRAVTILGGEVGEDPRADIFASPLAGLPPLTVYFDARDSIDPNGQPLTYEWDFGDGSANATGALVQHTYHGSGTFTVLLTARNPANNRFGEASVDIEVTNNSPNAKIVANPTSGGERLTVQFSAAQSTDQESALGNMIYQWDFGDGATANAAGLPGILIDTSHFYLRHPGGDLCSADDPCVFTAQLTVTDEGGKSDVDTVEIRVGNTNPVPVITYTALQGNDPHEVTFNAINSIDAENQSMSIRWDWGDGTTSNFSDLLGSDGEGNVTHEFTRRTGETVSTFHVTARITDEKGGRSDWPGAFVVVSEEGVMSSNPVAAFTIDPDPPVLNKPVTGDASASFDRPSGNAPTKYKWDWGDGGEDEGVTATHTYTQPGQYTIRLTVYDDEDPPNIGVKHKNIRVALTDGGVTPSDNHKPSAKIKLNQTEGIAGVTEFIFDASGSTDSDEDPLTYEWNFGDRRVSGAIVARVFDEPGVYSVTLTVKDPDNASDSKVVTITVRAEGDNRPPLALIGTGMRTGTAPLTLTFNGLGSYDPDGDPITYRWEFIHNGSLLADATSSVVTQTFEQAGVYQVVLEVSDGRGGVTRTDPETVTVTARVEGDDTTDGSGGGSGGRTIPDSAAQRPSGFCGLGMITSFFGSLIGLSFIRLTRRRLFG